MAPEKVTKHCSLNQTCASARASDVHNSPSNAVWLAACSKCMDQRQHITSFYVLSIVFCWNSWIKSSAVCQLFTALWLRSRAALEDSKKWGMLNLVNQLFKIYFKVTQSVASVRTVLQGEDIVLQLLQQHSLQPTTVATTVVAVVAAVHMTSVVRSFLQKLHQQSHGLLVIFIKHNKNYYLKTWRFDLYQRPSSEEAGTRH